MNSQFRPDELITKNNKSYPVVGARLRVAHEENQQMDISTELVSFETMDQAVVKATIKTEKGVFSAFGVASASKDTRLIDSLLELAETRAIARALRFAGYGVEYTSLEEIGDVPVPVEQPPQQQKAPSFQEVKAPSPRTKDFIPMTPPQRKAIESISKAKHWNSIEVCRRIVARNDLRSLDELSKTEASQVISRLQEQMAA